MSDLRAEPPPQISSRAWDLFLADAPWKATSVLAASATTLAGLAAWLNDMMSPALARGGASYIGGFFIGWAFRRALKAAVLLAGLVLAAITALKSTGWIDLDWASLESSVSQSLAWLHGEAEGFKQLLTGYLPSAGAGGAGAYFGFRKK